MLVIWFIINGNGKVFGKHIFALIHFTGLRNSQELSSVGNEINRLLEG